MAHRAKKDTKLGKGEEAKSSQKQMTLEASLAQSEAGDTGGEMLMLSELRKFREESGAAQKDMIDSQMRMETAIGDIKTRMDTVEERLTTAEARVSNAEDWGMRQDRALAYLLKRDVLLTTKLDDLENRMRRQNIRLYGMQEEAEGKDMIPFITDFLKTSLKLPGDLDIRIERAHRAMAPKPGPAAPPRSIIVRFLDFKVKQEVLQRAWKQREVEFLGKKVYFDQDYSPEVQRKRKQVREVIKKLKERDIKAQSPYPAQLKIFLDTGIKIFPSLVEAQPTLGELGIQVMLDERDILEREVLQQDGWQSRNRQKGNGRRLSSREIRAIINFDERPRED